MVAYAAVQDVYDLGLTAQAFVVRPRALDPRAGDALDPATGIFRMLGHGFTADDVVELVLVGAGAVPSGATPNVPYHPLPIDYFRFQLSASVGGPALIFGNAGSGAWGIQIDPERRLRRLCDVVSRDIDQDLIAHSTPILPDPTTKRYPDKLVGIVARTVARRAIAGMTFENAAFKAATERLQAEEERDEEQRARWRAGQPLLPQPLDQTPNKADAAMRAQGLAQGRACNANWMRRAL